MDQNHPENVLVNALVTSLDQCAIDKFNLQMDRSITFSILVSRLPGYAQLVPGASKPRTETRKTQTEEGNSKAVEDTTQHEC